MTMTWEDSSPARHSTDPARKICSTPAAASASRSGSASAFQKLRVVGRSHRTFPAMTGISLTPPASWPSSAVSPDSPKRPPPTAPPAGQQELRLGNRSPRRLNRPYEGYANREVRRQHRIPGLTTNDRELEHHENHQDHHRHCRPRPDRRVITADPGTGMGAVILDWTVSGTVTVDLTSGP